MTISERNQKLKYYITCLKCEVSGKCCDENCPTQCDAGNMGEIIENLEAISKSLEQQDALDKIRADIERLQKMCDKNDLNLLAQYSAFGMVLEIIDKYKAESEVES